MRRVPSGVLRPGESMPTHPAPQTEVALDFWGWLRGALTYKPMTARQARVAKWLCVALALPLAFSLCLIAARVTGGRVGAVVVAGNSASSVYPAGSIVFLAPARGAVCDGQIVVAYGVLEGDPDGEVGRQLMLKEYDASAGRLVSPDAMATSTSFEIRGRVVGGFSLLGFMDNKVHEPIIDCSGWQPKPGRPDPTPTAPATGWNVFSNVGLSGGQASYEGVLVGQLDGPYTGPVELSFSGEEASIVVDLGGRPRAIPAQVEGQVLTLDAVDVRRPRIMVYTRPGGRVAITHFRPPI